MRLPSFWFVGCFLLLWRITPILASSLGQHCVPDPKKNNDDDSAKSHRRVVSDSSPRTFAWAPSDPIRVASSVPEEGPPPSTTSTTTTTTIATTLRELSAVWGVPQVAPGPRFRPDVVAYLQQMQDYYQAIQVTSSSSSSCQNRHEHCTWYAIQGRCDTDTAWMWQHCRPVCLGCMSGSTQKGNSNMEEEEDPCQYHPPPSTNQEEDERNVWKGSTRDLDRMFQRLIQEHSASTQVLSRPGRKRKKKNKFSESSSSSSSSSSSRAWNDDPQGDPEKNGDDDDDDLPWIVLWDQVLSREEAAHLIELGTSLGFERSVELGGATGTNTLAGLEGGESSGWVSARRTSSTASCQARAACREDAVLVALQQRLSQATGIPLAHFEPVQFLHYQPGQYYQVHHDYLRHELQQVSGPRILTVLVYLNDVPSGGETAFSRLPSVPPVSPRAGRALLFPNVQSWHPDRLDIRTYHEALPVHAAETRSDFDDLNHPPAMRTPTYKYAMNFWFHLRPWVEECG